MTPCLHVGVNKLSKNKIYLKRRELAFRGANSFFRYRFLLRREAKKVELLPLKVY